MSDDADVVITITPQDAATALRRGTAVLLDVREPHEWATAYVDSAIHLPVARVVAEIAALVPHHDQSIICYCATGCRSARAADELRATGYRAVSSLRGGLQAWMAAGLPVERPADFSPEELQRYQRHLSLPDVGLAGQRALQQSAVLIVGAGGLGSPVAMYLAAAGVGTIGLVDDDVVDCSNLQRQIVHTTERIGTPKVESAAAMLRALNPHATVHPHPVRLTADNAAEICAPYQIVVDGSDNFPTRYVVSDVCVNLRKPHVYGGVQRFEGQVAVFSPGHGPCYRCLYPTPPAADVAPSCADAGVLGVVPGLIGLLQATEVLKLIVGCGEPLHNRLLCYNALTLRFHEFQLRKDPGCRCSS